MKIEKVAINILIALGVMTLLGLTFLSAISIIDLFVKPLGISNDQLPGIATLDPPGGAIFQNRQRVESERQDLLTYIHDVAIDPQECINQEEGVLYFCGDTASKVANKISLFNQLYIDQIGPTEEDIRSDEVAIADLAGNNKSMTQQKTIFWADPYLMSGTQYPTNNSTSLLSPSWVQATEYQIDNPCNHAMALIDRKSNKVISLRYYYTVNPWSAAVVQPLPEVQCQTPYYPFLEIDELKKIAEEIFQKIDNPFGDKLKFSYEPLQKEAQNYSASHIFRWTYEDYKFPDSFQKYFDVYYNSENNGGLLSDRQSLPGVEIILTSGGKLESYKSNLDYFYNL